MMVSAKDVQAWMQEIERARGTVWPGATAPCQPHTDGSVMNISNACALIIAQLLEGPGNRQKQTCGLKNKLAARNLHNAAAHSNIGYT
jgi:hypothetical protein